MKVRILRGESYELAGSRYLRCFLDSAIIPVSGAVPETCPACERKLGPIELGKVQTRTVVEYLCEGSWVRHSVGPAR